MRWRIGMAAIWLICLFAAVVSLLWMLVAIAARSERAWMISIGYDQLGNATTGGDEDQYISARCWENRHRNPYRWLQPLIDWAASLAGDHDHCRSAWEKERAKVVSRFQELSGE